MSHNKSHCITCANLKQQHNGNIPCYLAGCTGGCSDVIPVTGPAYWRRRVRRLPEVCSLLPRSITNETSTKQFLCGYNLSFNVGLERHFTTSTINKQCYKIKQIKHKKILLRFIRKLTKNYKIKFVYIILYYLLR